MKENTAPLTRYRLVEMEGDIIIYDMDTQKFLDDVSTLESIVEALSRNLGFMKNSNKSSQLEYQKHLGLLHSQRIIEEFGQWVLSDEDLLDMKNKRKSEAVAGVYFVKDSDWPNLIKIGHCTHLRKRLNQLQAETYGKVELISFIQCSEQKRLERTLHWAFAYCRRVGEWFDMREIMWYINHIRQNINDKQEQ